MSTVSAEYIELGYLGDTENPHNFQDTTVSGNQ